MPSTSRGRRVGGGALICLVAFALSSLAPRGALAGYREDVGYTALQATLSADDWQTTEKPVEFSITTASLDGDPQSAAGTVALHALKQPEHVQRAPLQPGHRWWYFRGDEPAVDPQARPFA